MLTLGVLINGSPSCWSDGAPSSLVQLAVKLRRGAGAQLRPAPNAVSVPKSLSVVTAALAFAVRRPIEALRLVIGRSRLAEPSALCRLRSDCPVEPAATRKVAVASPAGSANNGPVAVPS